MATAKLQLLNRNSTFDYEFSAPAICKKPPAKTALSNIQPYRARLANVLSACATSIAGLRSAYVIWGLLLAFMIAAHVSQWLQAL